MSSGPWSLLPPGQYDHVLNNLTCIYLYDKAIFAFQRPCRYPRALCKLELFREPYLYLLLLPKMAEASDLKGSQGDSASMQAITRVNVE